MTLLFLRIKIIVLILTIISTLNLIQFNLTSESSRRIKSFPPALEQLEKLIRSNVREIITDLIQVGYTQDEINLALNEIIEFIQTKRVEWGWWSNVSPAGITLALMILANQLDTKPYLLHERNLSLRVEAFNWKSLGGLRWYFQEASSDRLLAKFKDLKEEYFEDPQIKRFYILCKAARIFPETSEQVLERIRTSEYFLWAWMKYDPQLEKAVIEQIFREEIFPKLRRELPWVDYFNFNYYVPLELVSHSMFEVSLELLGGRTLKGFYEYKGRNLIGIKKGYGWYPEIKDKYLWINFIRLTHPSWSRGEIPERIIEHLVLRIAQEKEKQLSELKDGKDFYNLDFLSWKELGIKPKSLRDSLILAPPYKGIKGFKEKIINPLIEKIQEEVENIRREISENGGVRDWSSYSLWAIKTYIEEYILKPLDKNWQELKESDLPQGLLSITTLPKPPFLGNLNFLKAILWVDLDLYQRIFLDPITTEDWVTHLLWWGSIDWRKTSKGVRRTWIKMLAVQEGKTIEEILSQPADSEIWDKIIDFKSDPLRIFSETFQRLLPLTPKINPNRWWSLRPLLVNLYHNDPERLREDLEM